MKSIDFNEEEIQEYVDGVLTPADARRIERIISTNPKAKKYYLAQLRQKQLLKIWWKNTLN
ncbi:anti-sigma factor family protein [Sneathiella litorea]|uniref:Zinc-finger domain-containing protein n=1 Tax=Sneathiella litorea TaxID=2606216 RepID=A0A6L8W6N3_9PROT|nr:hypothetical protein [Sneathiella litorea]MZR30050.1 hypothetical protein [Sneathiella litorea]